jgi:hypothetical protein
VKHPFLGRAITEECDRDSIASVHLEGKPRPDGHGDRRADNRHRADESYSLITEVHGPTHPTGTTGVLAVNFRHHLFDSSAQGEEMRMRPVSTKALVGGAKVFCYPDRNSFLTDR